MTPPPASTTAETDPPSDGAAATTAASSYECIGSVVGYETMDQVLEQASVTVEGRITRQIGVDTLSGEAPDSSWSIWELEVRDAMGADVPAVLTVVDADRSDYDCADESSTPTISAGLDGVFALNSGEADAQLIHPDFGETYYAVTVLESTGPGFQDVLNLIAPIPSLGPYGEQIEQDNHRTN
ncbi:hypothetical protein [Serinicoccus sp. LYQ131]|uniref:hypothetical protein n=1 Tax=Serinicoccus sp. LYQ131 TaxID=3378797 RepID=UPI003852FD3E